MRGAHVTPVPVRPPVTAMDVAQASDLVLAEQAAHAGRMLDVAFSRGDRELALVWQQAMYAIVNLRRSRRFGSDTNAGGANLGG